MNPFLLHRRDTASRRCDKKRADREVLRLYKTDLHIHSCLSPCAELNMSPKNIIRSSLAKGLDIIAVCDHNSSANCPAVIEAAKTMGIHVIPGMEVTSQEEVHVLALFDEPDSALELQEHVYRNLPGKNDPEAFGMQVIVNHKGEVLGFEEKLLIGATSLPLEEIIRFVHSLEGLAIASHIDRQAFSILGQLGFIPDGIGLDALEISPLTDLKQARQQYGTGYPLITSSDAHNPETIGEVYTRFLLEAGTVAEIKKALKGKEGRCLVDED